MADEPKIIIRMCLKCSKEFKSKGVGNRLCEKCNTDNKHYSARQTKFGPDWPRGVSKSLQNTDQ